MSSSKISSRRNFSVFSHARLVIVPEIRQATASEPVLSTKKSCIHSCQMLFSVPFFPRPKKPKEASAKAANNVGKPGNAA